MTALAFPKKTLTAAAAALAMGAALAPTGAEARFHRNGWLAAGLVGGAIVGSAIAANSARAGGYYAPAYAGPDCYRVRQRVWSDYHGRFITVRRTVCD